MSDNAALAICICVVILALSSCQAVTEYAHAKYPPQKCVPETQQH